MDRGEIIEALDQLVIYCRAGAENLAGTVACENYYKWADAARCAAAMLKVQEIVQCKDCKHWREPFDKYGGGNCANCELFDDSHAFNENFYCAQGERREEA